MKVPFAKATILLGKEDGLALKRLLLPADEARWKGRRCEAGAHRGLFKLVFRFKRVEAEKNAAVD